MFFFFNDTATTEIYTLSLHDALPILEAPGVLGLGAAHEPPRRRRHEVGRFSFTRRQDRKSTRLNSSHLVISYAVFCLKKKTTTTHGVRHRPEDRPTPTADTATRSRAC